MKPYYFIKREGKGVFIAALFVNGLFDRYFHDEMHYIFVLFTK